ncbi:MAG: type II toxin-antitoxin system VapC family toxin [Acidobacteria bacterium]|nr:type II toxin-antitoxin system VapC family toxin [Acidobacteriota bacterium]MCI0624230.1 type II toxin-antitoxin system VapC family toxin [Acidobacteriota bacterium]MCI0721268.1 type II toxin-antitoxin system VapC family toxin [Acidobacteriota bacterium]
MRRRPKALVLDTWSVVAYFEDEPSGEQVADLIADAQESGASLAMSVVNAGELWYLMARRSSEADANESVTELRQLGIQLVDIDWDLARAAASFKSRHRMSYADCFAAALAQRSKAELVTGDSEFKQVEGDISIVWLKNAG